MRRVRVPMFAIAATLLGLIALLATLQYKWLGQISAAERERMAATLRVRAGAFGEDFDRELNRAYLLFQMTPAPADDSAPAQVGARYDRWQATARFPRMIKEIYLASAGEGQPLRRFNPATRFVEPAEWPGSLASVRAQLAGATELSPPASKMFMRPLVQPVWADVPALVVPMPIVFVSHLPRPGADLQMLSKLSYTVLVLDGDYIKSDMLPSLAQQHFQGTGDGFDYQLAVVPTTGAAPLYRSVKEFQPRVDAQVDASTDLFQLRVQDFGALQAEVSRFAMFAVTPGGARASSGLRSRTVFRESMLSNPGTGRTGHDKPQVSIIVQSPKPSSEEIDQLRSGAAAVASSARIASAPHWRLLVKHPSGSLEQAVNAVRRRNLVISSSVLGILGLSVGFLVLSTRRAQDLARQQLEFVATVSHELRTPLAVIRSAADNLADGVVDDEARIRQYGQLVRREGLRLTDLVEQILEFAGLQSGQRTMTARPVTLSTVLRETAAAADTAAARAGVAIELSIDEHLPAVAGDEAALRRVFQNLIGNAIKYGADGRWVGIRACFTAGRIEVSVTDRGVGIAAAHQAKIFDPFYRAPDVVAAQIQGAGLGLSLVKRIVEAHGGRITVKSAPGAGSTFTVALPALKGDPAKRRDGVGMAAAQPS
jgi:signal transduction histidine kinase